MRATEDADVVNVPAVKRPAPYQSGGGSSGSKLKSRCKPEAARAYMAGEAKEPFIDESSAVIQAFRNYQVQLDAKHDKYERLVKKSRDVTIESKRVIFLLHRILSDTERLPILKEAEEKLCTIQKTLLNDIALEIKDEDLFQYLRAFSPGLQEYVEAVTFYNYMKSESIASLAAIEIDLQFEHYGQLAKLEVPPSEYMLGLADLTGELMRRGINSVAQGNMEVPFKLALVLKDLYEGFNSLGMPGKDIFRKTRVLKQSLEKVEKACYNINIRGSEIPEHMMADVFSNEQSSSSREPQGDVF